MLWFVVIDPVKMSVPDPPFVSVPLFRTGPASVIEAFGSKKVAVSVTLDATSTGPFQAFPLAVDPVASVNELDTARVHFGAYATPGVDHR